MTPRLALAALALLALARCSAQHYAERDDARCVATGAPRGSQAYADCRTELFIERKYGPTAP